MAEATARSGQGADAPRWRKAKLAQDRSRLTRTRIVKAAVRLWNERGFDEGFDGTTVDEIADAAEVSRATVYYYFPKKEDILRELAWTTAAEIYECTLRSIMAGDTLDLTLDKTLGALGTMVGRSSPAAVRRMLQIRDTSRESLERDSTAGGLTRAFSVALVHAQEHGELPKTASIIEIAEMVSAIVMGCISKWSITGEIDLADTMRRRVRLVLAGVRR